ncbi:hypothetical protein FHS61_000575 [Altererythrobacter atlanticus]|uniref:Uncharacterized protein n=1 Tax=Croceibacterium atlanticum TaxID=1267766 RepID=A0A0F7KU52_9SPHN|nr:outer membrane beta-barrel protein [Croceibacterium atlanticum]AKH42802.1 hypothetical protein WYH_01766 [Croceibacterium atlanticum]MBB5731582.1 hypothetical protein [Croceibacterium atlanticum]
MQTEKFARRPGRTANSLALQAALLGIAISTASPAAAQSRDVSPRIDDRPRPEYAAEPIRIGSIEAYPGIEVESEYVDNLFGTETNKTDDIIISVVPSVDLRDTRSDRSLRLRLLGGVETYTRSNVDERFRGEAVFDGRFGLGTRTRPFIGAAIIHNTGGSGDRNDFRTIAQPLDRTTMRGNAGIEQEFGPIIATVEGQYRRTDYGGSYVFDNVTYDADFRDFETYTARGRLTYGASLAQGFYIEGSYNQRDYMNPGNGNANLPPNLLEDRSSDGYSVRAGYTRQLTDILQLDLSAGYLKQTYDSAIFASTDGFSFSADLFWAPTQLTNIQFGARRSIDDTENPLFSGLLRTDVNFSVQHELLRNLILRAQASYSVLEYDGVADSDDEYNISGSARYYVSRHWSLRLRAEHFNRSGSYELTQNRILFGIGYDF